MLSKSNKEILIKLRNKLKGKCGHLCPRRIIIVGHNKWKCSYCYKYFGFINNKYLQINQCPCHMEKINPEEIFLRLDELIETGE